MSDPDLSHLPWPAPWRRTRSATAVLVVLGLAAAVVVAVALVVTQGLSDPAVLVGLACVPVLVLLIVLIARTRLRGRPSAASVRPATPDEAPAGVAFPYRRDVAVLRVLLTGYLALLGLVLAVGGLTLLGREDGGGVATTVIGLVLLLASVPRLVAVARGRLRTGAVVLTPDGVVHRSWSFDLAGPWADVVTVRAGGDRQPHILLTMATRSQNARPVPGGTGAGGGLTVRTRAWRQTEARLAPHIGIPVGEVNADPALLLESLRFYAENPERRAELSGSAGLERIRRGDVLT